MSGKPTIPSWQRATADKPASSPPEPEQQSQSSELPERSISAAVEAPTPTEDDLEDSPGTTLLDQASKFLEDPTIRDAPREKKVAFLESKGVKAGDIETLLGEAAHEKDYMELEEAGERAWATVCNQAATP